LGVFGGAVFLLPLVLGTMQRLSGFDIYHAWPENSLLNQIDSGSDGAAQRAWDEMMRRRRAGGVSDSVELRLTELAIQENGRGSRRPFHNSLMQYLQGRFEKKKVSDEQAQRLFLPAVNSLLRARPIVAVGEAIPIELSAGMPGPLPNYGSVLILRQPKVGDRNIDEWSPKETDFRDIAIYAPIYEARGLPMPAGDWDVQARCMLYIDRNFWFGNPILLQRNPPPNPLWSGQVTLRTKVKVLETQPSTLITLIDRPQDAETMKDSIRVKNAKLNPVTGTVDFHFAMRQPPQNIAFHVLARWNGREQELFWLTLPKGGKVERDAVFHAKPPPAKFDVVLRADPALARRSVDLFEIWKDDIVIDSVPFEVAEDKPVFPSRPK
jgi:hypothetical protein